MNEKIKAEYNIPLGNGKYATIDLTDLDKIQGYSWSFFLKRGKSPYCRGWKLGEKVKRETPFLHQIILGTPPPGLQIGHWDGNGLNCRKYNLRFLTPRQNSQGVRAKRFDTHSRYRGVTTDKNDHHVNPWRSRLFFKGRLIDCGRFSNEIDAAKAYDKKARELFGEYAAPNFPL